MLLIICSLLILGIFFLILALRLSVRLVKQLPVGSLQKKWHILSVLILSFILSYIYFVVLVSNIEYQLVYLIVAGIFLVGSIFVFSVCTLTSTTIEDIQRMAVLEKESINDPLMNIYNRRFFDRSLNDEIEKSLRYKFPLSLLLLDVDHFKSVNDTYGHIEGDLALIKLAEILVKSTRNADIVARYGGEEVVIILPNTGAQGASVIAERCRENIFKELTAQDKQKPEQSPQQISASVGVSSICNIITSKEALIKAADDALYQAKDQGRNRVISFKPS